MSQRTRASTSRRPTIITVAEAAGVSPATVSRVLSGSSAVTPDLAARVHRAADELSYRPSSAARGLVLGSMRSVGGGRRVRHRPRPARPGRRAHIAVFANSAGGVEGTGPADDSGGAGESDRTRSRPAHGRDRQLHPHDAAVRPPGPARSSPCRVSRRIGSVVAEPGALARHRDREGIRDRRGQGRLGRHHRGRIRRRSPPTSSFASRRGQSRSEPGLSDGGEAFDGGLGGDQGGLGPPPVAEDLDLHEAPVAGAIAPVDESGHVDAALAGHAAAAEFPVNRGDPVGELDGEQLVAGPGDLFRQRRVPPHVIRVDPDPHQVRIDGLDQIVRLLQRRDDGSARRHHRVHRFDGEPHPGRPRVGLEFGDAVPDLPAGAGEIAVGGAAHQVEAIRTQGVRLIHGDPVVVHGLSSQCGGRLREHPAAADAADPQTRLPQPGGRGSQVQVLEHVSPQADAAETPLLGEVGHLRESRSLHGDGVEAAPREVHVSGSRAPRSTPKRVRR
ncbi:putative LacI family transcriptional regulator [Rhodococcus opacus B4]|uniref:Putative LacI family transcriptional regulator n=1 Tax=Rhodococcus opacus (strain B4) TaxID=632772 RepID=C1B7L9_RHOOB|nr:putative LacI family transcriptional regulator [Rhodococcus opacus B4]